MYYYQGEPFVSGLTKTKMKNKSQIATELHLINIDYKLHQSIMRIHRQLHQYQTHTHRERERKIEREYDLKLEF